MVMFEEDGLIPRTPDGRVDWQILGLQVVTLLLALGSVAIFVAWLLGW